MKIKFLTLVISFIAGTFGTEQTKAVKTVDLISSEDPKLAGQLFHPNLSPSSADILTFVRQERDNRQLWLFDVKSGKMNQITPFEQNDKIEDWEEADGGSLFQQYADQLEWCPKLHKGKQYVAYVSAGKGNNMDIYIHEIGSKIHTRLTWDLEVDGSPRWSPDGKSMVFVSARTGNGDLYYIEDVTEFMGENLKKEPKNRILRLTKNRGEDMLPSWSPNGRYLAYTARTAGKRKRGPYTIALMDFKDKRKRVQLFNNRIVNSKSHPSWSFDGHFVAYQISNDLNDRAVDIGVMQLKIDPMGRLVELTDLVGNTPKIAENVYPNSYRGPTWLPGSRALIYAKRESKRLNPLEVVNLEQWLYNQNYKRTTISTNSNIHRDVDCLKEHPIIVFAGQSGLTFKIFGSFLSGADVKVGGNKTTDNYALFK